MSWISVMIEDIMTLVDQNWEFGDKRRGNCKKEEVRNDGGLRKYRYSQT